MIEQSRDLSRVSREYDVSCPCLPTDVDSMNRNTVSLLASLKSVFKSCPFILAKILIFLKAIVLNIDSRSLLHLRHLSMRWFTFCYLLPHHQQRVSCAFFILKRCTPVTACPDFSCRYRAVADFFESPRYLFILATVGFVSLTLCCT